LPLQFVRNFSPISVPLLVLKGALVLRSQIHFHVMFFIGLLLRGYADRKPIKFKKSAKRLCLDLGGSIDNAIL